MTEGKRAIAELQENEIAEFKALEARQKEMIAELQTIKKEEEDLLRPLQERKRQLLRNAEDASIKKEDWWRKLRERLGDLGQSQMHVDATELKYVYEGLTSEACDCPACKLKNLGGVGGGILGALLQL